MELPRESQQPGRNHGFFAQLPQKLSPSTWLGTGHLHLYAARGLPSNTLHSPLLSLLDSGMNSSSTCWQLRAASQTEKGKHRAAQGGMDCPKLAPYKYSGSPVHGLREVILGWGMHSGPFFRQNPDLRSLILSWWMKPE